MNYHSAKLRDIKETRATDLRNFLCFIPILTICVNP
jgi:hypothetical protein